MDVRPTEEFAHRLRRANLHQAEQQPELAPVVVTTAQIHDGVRTWTTQRDPLKTMFHCHILDHEDLGTMANIQVG